MGRWEDGAERQKVRGRRVLMTICRAGLWYRQELVGTEGMGVCVGGWMDGEKYRWSEAREEGGEGSVVSSWPVPWPLIRAA